MTTLQRLASCVFALCALLPAANAQSDPPGLQFVLEQVHKKNFRVCDAAIRQVFGSVGGDDARVNTSWTDETKADSLKVSVIWGRPMDAVFTEAEFRRVGKACVGTTTSVLSNYGKSCTSYLAENQAWKIEADTVGVLSTRNAGGVNLTLVPTPGGCIQIFQRTVIE